jgi:predicted ATP-grasp superfamily ATP-dependent carboligase
MSLGQVTDPSAALKAIDANNHLLGGLDADADEDALARESNKAASNS